MARRSRYRFKNASALSSMCSSLASSAVSTPWASPWHSRASSPEREGVFPFWKLPAELRIKIYQLVMCSNDVVDLHPVNYFRLYPRLSLFLVCRRMHEEAYPVFYGENTFRIFPYDGRFINTKQPLLARLPSHYRNFITSLELRLGPGWTAPPKCQNVNPSLGLHECQSLRTLKIFVEIDPSDSCLVPFKGPNATEHTYKAFCFNLLLGIMEQVPSMHTVEIDAYPSVKKDAPLIVALRRGVEEAGKTLVWGPLRGWEKEVDEPGLIGLEKALAGMSVSDIATTSRMVEAMA